MALFNRSQRFLGDTSVAPSAAVQMVLAVPNHYPPAKSMLQPATQEHINKVFYRQQKKPDKPAISRVPHLRGADTAKGRNLMSEKELSPLRGADVDGPWQNLGYRE